MEEKPFNSPASGRRVMSGSDAGVTYHADDKAQLVPPPINRSDSSHQRESRGSGRRRSNFSQQISATRYGTSHLYQRTNKVDDEPSRHAPEPSQLPILEPKVYTPARPVHKATPSKDKVKPAAAQQEIGGSSPAQSLGTSPARRRPPPLTTHSSKSLRPKRSLSNFKTKGEEFTRSVREKLGFHSASSHSGDLSARQFDGNGESALVAPDKALRVLGAKGDLTATTRASEEDHPSALSALFKTPLHSASDISRTSTSSTRKSADTYEGHSLVGGQFGQHLKYLNDDTPPTPPTQKKPPVPPKDSSSLSTRYENDTSPTRTGKPQAKSVAGYRERPDVNVSDVKSMYGTYSNQEEGVLARRSRNEDDGSGGLRPIPEYTPSMYSSVSMRPDPLHVPSGEADTEERPREASGVSVPLYNDVPSESETTGTNSRRTSILNIATYIHDLGAQFQFSIIASIMADLRSQDSHALEVDVLTRLKARLEAIGTLPEIGRLDTVDGIEQTIQHLQERLAAMKIDPMTTSQVSVLRPMWDEAPVEMLRGHSGEQMTPARDVDQDTGSYQNDHDTPLSPKVAPSKEVPATATAPSAPIPIPLTKKLQAAVDRLRSDTPDSTTRPNSQDSNGFVGVFTMTGVTTPLGTSPLRVANNTSSSNTPPFTNSEFNLAIRQIAATRGPGPSISPGEASASSYDADYVEGHDIAQPQEVRGGRGGGGGGAQGYFERAGRRSPQHQWAVQQARVALSREREAPREVHPAHRKGE